ncbi:hypothetical protein EV44_g5114 [Erysiphe necator]|uniref:HAT C-terminal dimerisation domain-containing protein n=1 Tax=Uncinula necator TaxID=52586 RepID=A0A0B1PHD2_UNCNE|nr:hypothetical protein EV44_g5114 [Erysiphe necator]
MSTPNPNSSSINNSPFEGAQITEAKDREFVIFPERGGTGIVGNGRTTLVQEKFLSWWKTTNYGSGRNRLPSSVPNRRGLTIGLDKIWITSTRGHIWPLFRQLAALGNGEPKVQCTICEAVLQHPKATHQGSGSLTRHVQGQHPTLTTPGPRTSNAHRLLVDQTILPNTHSTGSCPPENLENTERDRRRAFLQFGLAKKLPFNWAEDPATAALISRLGLQIRPPGRNELKSELESHFSDVQIRINQALKTRFKASIAIDIWKSSHHLNFLAIVAYWIDKDWKFHEALIDAPLISECAPSQEIGKSIINVLYKYKLHSRLLGVTSTEDDKLVCALGSLEGILGEKNIRWKTADSALRCIAHAILLAANAFCQSLKIQTIKRDKEIPKNVCNATDLSSNLEPAITVSKIRSMIKLIKSSSARFNRFKALQRAENVQIPLISSGNFTAQWISMYWMITYAYLNQTIINKWKDQEVEYTHDPNIIQKLHKLTITSEEWYHVRLITSVLKPLVTLTDVLLRTQGPLIHRSHVFLSAIFDGLKSKLSMHMHNTCVSGKLKGEIVSALEAAIQKIEIFYHGPDGSPKLLYNLAMILDPTRKLLLFQEWDNHENSSTEKYQKMHRKEFIDYFIENYQHTTSSPPEIALFRPSFQVRRSLETQAMRYLDSEVVDDDGGEFNLLNWWQKNEKEYPELAKMAHDVLCVAISGIGVRQIFNQGRDIQNYIEARLDGEAISKALVLVNALGQTTASLEPRQRRPHLPDDPDDLFDEEDLKENPALEFNQEDINDDDEFYSNNYDDNDNDDNDNEDEDNEEDEDEEIDDTQALFKGETNLFDEKIF